MAREVTCSLSEEASCVGNDGDIAREVAIERAGETVLKIHHKQV